MIIDNDLVLSDAQAVTAAADSTNYINTREVRDIGTGESLYLAVMVTETLTDGGSNTGTVVSLQGDSTTTFSPDATQSLFTFAQGAAAGTVKYARLDPGMAPLQYQYINIRYAPAGANLTGGKFTAAIVKDVQQFVAYANNYTVS